MKQKIYQIDAFASKVFTGNPAAVCILENWLADDLMQSIAEDNNLAETAFAVKNGEQYGLRWFTPETEVDLCGHATLATAFVLFEYYGHASDTIDFYSERSGQLIVKKTADGLLCMDFPTDLLQKTEPNSEVNEAIGVIPLETFKGNTDYMLVFPSQEVIEGLKPNFFLLDKIDCRGVICTAPGGAVDFVSRAFLPQCGIPEDPVTGSAHTTLTPYWAQKLKKTKLTAKQLSQRGGYLVCEYLGERVKISGRAAPYLIGEIEV